MLALNLFLSKLCSCFDVETVKILSLGKVSQIKLKTQSDDVEMGKEEKIM